MLELDLVQTLAFGGVVLMAGYLMRRLVPVLGRVNMPAPVLGGLLVSVVVWVGHVRGVQVAKFDTTLQAPLMIAFFTTVGFGASLSMLRVGGPMVAKFLLFCAVFAALQNVVGVGVALLFGLDPLFGVIAGSMTMTGGPATGLAFGPLFEQAGVQGATTIALAMAMAGIVAGALVGGPVATWIIHRHRLQRHDGVQPVSPRPAPAPAVAAEVGGDDDDAVFPLMTNIVVLLVAMWLGTYVSRGFEHLGVTLPAYIGAMLVAAVIRNIDDRLRWFRLSHRVLDTLGVISLSLFLVLALMSLRLWELAGLALPMVAALVAQVVMIAAAALFVFSRMGRDYEAAVMGGGFVGFMLGTMANAMAVMHALVERYGAAPRAFLVAPLVGAFFIDFINALIITTGLNVLQ